MRLIALVALRSCSRSGQLEQRGWRPLQIQGPGRQYVYNLHSMDDFTFTTADTPAIYGSLMREAL